MEIGLPEDSSMIEPGSKESANSKALVQRSLCGTNHVRPVVGPLAVHYCAELAGVSMRDYTLNPRTLADCVLRYYEAFRPDAIWISADTWVTAEAMGATVAFPSGNQPMAGTGRPCIRCHSDIDRIAPPNPETQGRCPVMLDAMRLVADAVGDEVFIVACFDQYPFSLACALMGIESLMVALVDDRSMVHALMERCAEYAVAYGCALSAAGADLLSGGDSPAGLIGPRLYREVALPFEQRVISTLKGMTATPVSLHICGDSIHILADMAVSGADVVELDHQISVVTACRTLKPETAIWGNLDPVGLLAQSDPDGVREATIELMQAFDTCGRRRFVVSSGCTLAPATPEANLRALINTVRNTPCKATVGDERN